MPSPSMAPPGSRRKDPSMPCSEKEMKALMSMFVEIMGLQMNTDKLNKPRNTVKSLFKFPDDLPPPPGGWPEMWPYDDDSVDSIPELEDIDAVNQVKHPPTTVHAVQVVHATVLPEVEPEPVTGLSGISPFDWDSLERFAIEDALEQEERARKNNIKAKEAKKSRTKEKSRKEEQAKAQEALIKKREKVIATWKSRVAISMQSLEQLGIVLSESPLRKEDSKDARKEHMDSLIQLCAPKNRASVERGKEIRERLVSFILDLSPISILTPLRNGRNIFHVACFYGDVSLIDCVMAKLTEPFKHDVLEATCLDSGFVPLHYAVLSGDSNCVEALLCNSASLHTLTNDTHTWSTSNGKGFTPRQLIECLLQQNQKELESHGMAVQEVTKEFLSLSRRRGYLALLERFVERLKNVETNGYAPLTKEEVETERELARQALEECVESLGSVTEGASKIRSETSLDTADDSEETIPEANAGSKSLAVVVVDDDDAATTTATTTKSTMRPKEPPIPKGDTLEVALMQMGFERKMVIQGIKACGGHQRAIPDDVVAWIISQDHPNHQHRSIPSGMKMKKDERLLENKEPRSRKQQSKRLAETKRIDTAKKAEDERIAAERLAAKREEQRRRNREWNNRTHARQLQEVNGAKQGPIAVKLANGLDMQPSPNLFDERNNVSENSMGVSLAQSTANNDASTIGSIAEIHVEVNDDQTVSTLGSWQQTRPPPLPVQPVNQHRPASQFVPPGFGQGMVQPTQPLSEPIMNSGDRGCLPHGAGTILPPGLPQSRPVMIPTFNRGPVPTFNGGPGAANVQQLRLPVSHASISGSGVYNYGNDNQASIGHTQSHVMHGGEELNFSAFHTTGLGLSVPPSRVPPQLSDTQLPRLSTPSPLGYGGLHSQQKNYVESSFIDSISTGGALIGDPSLWGDNRQSGGHETGSSLLGNLIQTNSSSLRGSAGVIGGATIGSIGGAHPFGTVDESTSGWGKNAAQKRPGSIW